MCVLGQQLYLQGTAFFVHISSSVNNNVCIILKFGCIVYDADVRTFVVKTLHQTFIRSKRLASLQQSCFSVGFNFQSHYSSGSRWGWFWLCKKIFFILICLHVFSIMLIWNCVYLWFIWIILTCVTCYYYYSKLTRPRPCF